MASPRWEVEVRETRRAAFAAIERHIGGETCPDITRAQNLVMEVGPHVSRQHRRKLREAVDLVEELRGVNRHLRLALAAALTLLADPDADPCPLCDEPTDDHNPRCLLERLRDGLVTGGTEDG